MGAWGKKNEPIPEVGMAATRFNVTEEGQIEKQDVIVTEVEAKDSGFLVKTMPENASTSVSVGYTKAFGDGYEGIDWGKGTGGMVN